MKMLSVWFYLCVGTDLTRAKSKIEERRVIKKELRSMFRHMHSPHISFLKIDIFVKTISTLNIYFVNHLKRLDMPL